MRKLAPAVDAVFAIKLGKFIRYNFSTDGCDYDRADELYKNCGVKLEDLKSWAKAEEAPSPIKKRNISNYIDEQKRKGRVW